MNIKEEVERELRMEIKIIGNKVIEKTIDLTLAEVEKVLKISYRKCKECYDTVKTEQMKQDFHQRMDEVLLIYSHLFYVSVNEAKQKLDAEDNKKVKNK